MTLSPGQFYKQVPKDLPTNLKFRLFTLEKARNDPALQAALMEYCKKDILFFINVFCFQFNPKSIGQASTRIGPFITWPFQDQALIRGNDDKELDPGILWCVEHQEDLVIEKSREMGASWLILLVGTWFLLFHDWFKVLVLSRNAEAVDRPDDPDSLFWKIDHVLEYLPPWMVKDIERRKMGFKNTRTHTYLNGQATTGKAGVGGRCDLLLTDEFSQIEEDYEIFHRTSDTAACRIFNGTHVGTGTCFYELTDPQSVVGSFINHLKIHWTQHPDKYRGAYFYDVEGGKIVVLDKTYQYPPDFKFVYDAQPAGGPFPGIRSPWYDEQCKRKGSARAVAMDLDIDPKGSVSQYFDSLLIKNLIYTYAEPYTPWEGVVNYDPQTGEPDRDFPLEQVDGGPLKLWIPGHSGRVPPKIPVGLYFLGCDVSEGVGATPSCASGINEQGEKVLEYVSSRIRPEAYATLIVALCRIFRTEDGSGARLGWECPGPGLHFGKQVLDLGYRNIYYNEHLPETPWSEVTDKPGWYSVGRSKKLLLDNYRAALANKHFCNHSKAALEECLRFEYDAKGLPVHPMERSKQDHSGAAMNHGDITMADAIAWMLADKAVRQIRRHKTETEIPVGSFMWRREYRQANQRKKTAWA